MQNPYSQGLFWQQEIDRIFASGSLDAETQLGAALVIDNPVFLNPSTQYHLLYELPGLQVHHHPEDQTWYDSRFPYERELQAKRVELLEQAIKQEPTNLNWRRVRAILLLRPSLMYGWENPRDENWKQVLQQCAAADPENALYDYIAAAISWDQSSVLSVSPTYSGGGYVEHNQLTIEDAELYARGNNFFDAAQQKPFCASGDVDTGAILKFLALADVTAEDRVTIAADCNLLNRQNILFWKLLVLKVTSAEQAAAGEQKEADATMLQAEHLVNQWKANDDPLCLQMLEDARYDLALRKLVIAATAKSPPTEPQLQELRAAAIEHNVSRLVLNKALGDTLPSPPQLSIPALLYEKFRSGSSLISSWLALAIVPPLVAALLFAVAARLLGERPAAPVGMMIPAATLAVAIALSLVIFGAAPAQLIPVAVQTWTSIVIFTLVIVSIVLPAMWGILVRREKLFGVRGLTAIAAFIGAVILVRVIAGFAPDSIRSWPPQFEVPTLAFADSYEWLRTPLGTKGDEWQIVALEWSYYRGPYLTLAVWLASVGLFAWWFSKRLLPGEETSPSLKERFASMTRTLAGAGVGLALTLLLLYLLITPIAITAADASIAERLAEIGVTDPRIVKLPAEIAAIRADKAEIARLEKISGSHIDLTVQEELKGPPDDSAWRLELDEPGMGFPEDESDQ